MPILRKVQGDIAEKALSLTPISTICLATLSVISLLLEFWALRFREFSSGEMPAIFLQCFLFLQEDNLSTDFYCTI